MMNTDIHDGAVRRIPFEYKEEVENHCDEVLRRSCLSTAEPLDEADDEEHVEHGAPAGDGADATSLSTPTHGDLLRFYTLFTTRDSTGALAHSLDDIMEQMGVDKIHKRTYVTSVLAAVLPHERGTPCDGAFSDEQRARFSTAWDERKTSDDDDVWPIHVANARGNVYGGDKRSRLSVALVAESSAGEGRQFTDDQLAEFHSLYTLIDDATSQPMYDRAGIMQCMGISTTTFKDLLKIARRDLGVEPRRKGRVPRGFSSGAPADEV